MTDQGNVDFKVDLGRGVVIVSVRPPLGLEGARVAAEIPILDFLDLSAKMLLGVNEVQRQAIAQLRNGQIPTTAPLGAGRPQ